VSIALCASLDVVFLNLAGDQEDDPLADVDDPVSDPFQIVSYPE
jgi:hypothetical protein